MNDLIVLLIIWIIITIINQVFKKSKAQKGKPAPSKPQESPEQQLPPTIKKLLGIPDNPPEFQQKSEEEVLWESETQEEPLEAGEPSDWSVTSEQPELPSVSTAEETTPRRPIKTDSFEEAMPATLQKTPEKMLKKSALKQAVIWKEILDRPLSLRNNRLSPYLRGK
ncbi:MAG: hypothetical protein Kow0042_22580 [Calditrichia bacterium]